MSLRWRLLPDIGPVHEHYRNLQDLIFAGAETRGLDIQNCETVRSFEREFFLIHKQHPRAGVCQRIA